MRRNKLHSLESQFHGMKCNCGTILQTRKTTECQLQKWSPKAVYVLLSKLIYFWNNDLADFVCMASVTASLCMSLIRGNKAFDTSVLRKRWAVGKEDRTITAEEIMWFNFCESKIHAHMSELFIRIAYS